MFKLKDPVYIKTRKLKKLDKEKFFKEKDFKNKKVLELYKEDIKEAKKVK